MYKKGILVIISGPSGSGKGTVVSELIKEDGYALSISATTRSPRSYEKDGEHYFFYSREEFDLMVERGQLLEWAEFCGHCYGTPRAYVESQLLQGKNVLLEIEVQGALQVKKLHPECVLVFLIPPNLEELGNRLTLRGTEDKDTINRRIHRALEEIDYVSQYDYVVINHCVADAKKDLDSIVRAEMMRCSRNPKIKEIFKGEIL